MNDSHYKPLSIKFTLCSGVQISSEFKVANQLSLIKKYLYIMVTGQAIYTYQSS